MSQQIDSPQGLYGSTATESEQRSAFTEGDVPVAVYGLGKMGLPLAAVYAEVTGNVVGADIDSTVVDRVNAGESHVEREPGLPELVESLVDRNALRAVSDPTEAAKQAAIHVLMVPTLLTGDDAPDLSTLLAATRDVAAGLSPGDLVIVESTVPPGTTADRIVPLLEAVSGLDDGEFGAAACPERTSSGRALQDVRGAYPKVVGGVDAESTRVAALVYDEVSDNRVITTPDARTAEAVKVFEGVYRDVNIALANQLSRYAEVADVDVNAAIEVANTQPFCDIHDPGPGVGGHCIPVYPHFLLQSFDVEAPLLSIARSVNDGMPAHTIATLDSILEERERALDGATVLVLGLTYRGNVAEIRNAPSIPIARMLQNRGATVLASDPVLDDWTAFDGVERIPVGSVTETDPDAVLVLADHDEFESLDWSAFDAPILDGRKVLEDVDPEIPVFTIGGRRA
ncbi:MAG: nucleotide sugar dehydrogenase [Halobacteriota archaeon]